MPMHRFPLAAAGVALVVLAAPALAQKPKAQSPQPQHIGGSHDWAAYSYPSGGGKICYLVGTPAKSEPAGAKRDAVNALVTHNTAVKTSNVVSFIAGYTFKEKSDAELEIDGKKFSLFTNNDTAWARDAGTDKAIVEAMQKGKQVVVKGTSQRGTDTTDTYSLTGFTDALGRAKRECGAG